MEEGYAFISYSTKNQAEAETIRMLLRNHGIATWMAPMDIPVGSKYAKEINQAVKHCSCFVLVLTEAAQDSVWVAKEAERAVNYRRPIVPIQLEPVTLNDEFELYISSNQLVSVEKLDENSEEIRSLLAGIARYISQGKDGRGPEEKPRAEVRDRAEAEPRERTEREPRDRAEAEGKPQAETVRVHGEAEGKPRAAAESGARREAEGKPQAETVRVRREAEKRPRATRARGEADQAKAAAARPLAWSGVILGLLSVALFSTGNWLFLAAAAAGLWAAGRSRKLERSRLATVGLAMNGGLPLVFGVVFLLIWLGVF